jgi:hypothetical protein
MFTQDFFIVFCYYTSFLGLKKCFNPEVLKLWGPSLSWWGGHCMRDILLLNEIQVQGKIYILIGTLLG